jgi:hypothetical protein
MPGARISIRPFFYLDNAQRINLIPRKILTNRKS